MTEDDLLRLVVSVQFRQTAIRGGVAAQNADLNEAWRRFEHMKKDYPTVHREMLEDAAAVLAEMDSKGILKL